MKLPAYILTTIFVLVLAMLHVQPLLGMRAPKKQSCMARCCHKQSPCQKKDNSSDDKKDCPGEGCNPFMPCAVGSCCYIVEAFVEGSTIYLPGRQKLPLFNDNRLLNKASAFWHPPEVAA